MAKFLVVDDSDVLRSEVCAALLEAGHEVVEAENGALGLAQAEAHDDLAIVITDLNMPVMDGITMSARIHTLDRYKNVPVFMLTTESSQDLKIAGKEAGVMVWMVKPLKKDFLLKAVTTVLAKLAAAA